MKKVISFILAITIIICGVPFAASATTVNESLPSETTETNDYIYYSDLFYAYPNSLLEDRFLQSYNNDVNYVCNVIYTNYNNSAAKFGTVMERTLEVVTSPANLTKQITHTLGLTDFDKNKAYDTANQKFVKYLLNTPASDSLQSAYGKTADITKKIKSIMKMCELSAKVDENKSAEQYLLDIAYSLWKDGILSNLSSDTLANILKELDASGTTLSGIFGLAATEFEIAQSFVIALMMEDIRMEKIDEIIASQTTGTILKEGMTRLKAQLSGGFVTYFISNYISGKLLDEVLKAVGDVVYTVVGVKLISDILSVAEKIAFDILLDLIPSYGDVLAYQVLINYSNCLYSAIQEKANGFIKKPTISNEISKYESLFTAYVAANKATFDIVDIFAPYDDVYAIFREAMDNGITFVTINGEKYSSNISIEEIDNILLEKLLSGQLVLTIDNGISKKKVYNKAEACASIFADSLLESQQIRADFTDKYRNSDIFELHIDSAKSQISGEPTVNWTYVISENTILRAQSDTIEPNSIYAYNNKLLGNTNVNGDINITFPLEVMGNLWWNNAVDKTFKICSNNTLRVNGDFSLKSGDPGYGKTSYSYFTVESGAKMSVGKNLSVEGHTALADGMGYINTSINGDLQVDGNLNINDITNTYIRGYLNVNGDFNQTAISHTLDTTTCKVWVNGNANCLINGNFNLKGAYYGNVDVNWAVFEVSGGSFEVKGDLNATDRFVALKQTGSNSQWIIRGDVYVDVLNKNYVPGFSSGLPAYTCDFTAGTLIIGGDFNIVNNPITFTNTHTVVFNGTETQTITNLKANNLRIINTSSNGVCFSGISYVTMELNTYTSKLVNGENLIVNGGKFVGDMLDGNISVQGNITFTNDIKINGSLHSIDHTTNQIVIPKGVAVTIEENANFKTSTGSVTVHVNDGAELSVLGNLLLIGKDRNPNWQYADIYIDGNVFVGGNLSCSSCYHFYQKGKNSYTIVQGNLTFQENGWFYSYKDITAGTVSVKGKVHNYEATGNNVLLLNGISTQRVSADSVYTHKFGTVAATILIENTNGVSFEATVTVSTLFNHQGNNFTLYNNGSGSSFVDYDGDGLKDNVDPEPTVGNPCTLIFKSEDQEKGYVSTETIETVGGTTITVTATPTFKYDFAKWVDSTGKTVTTSAEYSFVAKSAETYTAIFTKRQRYITTQATGGTINAPYKAEIESSVSVTVIENDGYVYTEGSLKYNNIPIENGSFIMPDEFVILTAEFVKNDNYFALNEVLSNAKSYTYEVYTRDSFANLTNAIKDAEASLTNNITAEESSKQIALLQDAINGLSEKYISSITLNTSPLLYWNVPNMINSISVLVTYDNSTTLTVAGSECTIDGFDATAIGEQKISITYDGAIGEATITVRKRAIGECMISGIEDRIYDGITEAYTLCLNLRYFRMNEMLTENTDFVAEYSNNTEIGEATVKITGIGNYAGSRTITFKIYCEHNYNEIGRTEASCDRIGQITEQCSVCGKNRAYKNVVTENLPESAHNYPNNCDVSYYYTDEGADSLELLFSGNTETENSYDKIYIYGKSGNLIGTYSGNALAGKSITVSGDTVRIRLTSDSSAVRYGFSLVSITGYFDHLLIPMSEHNYGEWSTITEPTPHSVGYKHRFCTECNKEMIEEIPTVLMPSFKGASLSLHHNLAVNFKANKALFEEIGYTSPYVVFEINEVKTIVRNYTVDGNRYVFKFRNIAPNQMNDTIYATLYATYDGVVYASETKEYSVAEYCYGMLSNYSSDEYAKLRTLLVDLLHYGAQSQLYTQYKTDELVNSRLTDTQLAWGTAYDPVLTNSLNTAYETVDEPTVVWKGAGLILKDSITMRFKIVADSVDGLTVKIKTDTDEWSITSDKFVKSGDAYYVYFNALNASQMSENVYLTVYSGNVAVSDTVCYSIESYAYEKQNSSTEYVADLVKAMMKYGNSAYNYVN